MTIERTEDGTLIQTRIVDGQTVRHYDYRGTRRLGALGRGDIYTDEARGGRPESLTVAAAAAEDRRRWADSITGPIFRADHVAPHPIAIEKAARLAMLVRAWDSFDGRETGGVGVGFVGASGIVIVEVSTATTLRSEHSVTLDILEGERLARQLGCQVVATFHTHPGPDRQTTPSPGDQRATAGAFNLYGVREFGEIIITQGECGWVDAVMHGFVVRRDPSLSSRLLVCEPALVEDAR